MYLVMLMIFPVLIGIVGLFWTKGRINWKEFLALEAAVFIVVFSGFLIARYSSTADVEVWSGRVVDKRQVKVSCSHSYPCNPYPCNCDSKGNCSTCYHTCYDHSYDWDWNVYTSNREEFDIDRVDRQGVNEPPRWTRVYIGEPTALTHYYENYIKANPDSVLRRMGAAERFKNLLPAYPSAVYDYNYVDRFVSADVAVPDAAIWNKDLQDLNADLGKKKQVNVIVLAAKTADPQYAFAIEEAWIGGKQNDIIVILGVPEYPKVSWVKIVSWTRKEELKIGLRDAIKDIGSMEKRVEIVHAIRSVVDPCGEAFWTGVR